MKKVFALLLILFSPAIFNYVTGCTSERARALLSPDAQWLATVNQEQCGFDPTTPYYYSVTVAPNSLARFILSKRVFRIFDAYSIRHAPQISWKSDNNLQVRLCMPVNEDYIQQKLPSHGDVQINYTSGHCSVAPTEE